MSSLRRTSPSRTVRNVLDCAPPGAADSAWPRSMASTAIRCVTSSCNSRARSARSASWAWIRRRLRLLSSSSARFCSVMSCSTPATRVGRPDRVAFERPGRVLDPHEAARRVLVPIDARETLDAFVSDVPARLDHALPVVRMHVFEPERPQPWFLVRRNAEQRARPVIQVGRVAWGRHQIEAQPGRIDGRLQAGNDRPLCRLGVFASRHVERNAQHAMGRRALLRPELPACGDPPDIASRQDDAVFVGEFRTRRHGLRHEAANPFDILRMHHAEDLIEGHIRRDGQPVELLGMRRRPDPARGRVQIPWSSARERRREREPGFAGAKLRADSSAFDRVREDLAEQLQPRYERRRPGDFLAQRVHVHDVARIRPDRDRHVERGTNPHRDVGGAINRGLRRHVVIAGDDKRLAQVGQEAVAVREERGDVEFRRDAISQGFRVPPVDHVHTPVDWINGKHAAAIRTEEADDTPQRILDDRRERVVGGRHQPRRQVEEQRLEGEPGCEVRRRLDVQRHRHQCATKAAPRRPPPLTG